MSMRDQFKGYYRPAEDEFGELWQKGIIAFDTNVLLGLYRYPKEAREDFLNVMKHIIERIWIPHQVVLEFQKNRLGEISDQLKKYSDVEKIINKTKNDLHKDLSALQLQNRHSSINPDNCLSKIDKIISSFQTNLNELKKDQPSVSDQDQIRDTLDSMLKGKIGSPLSSQELTDLYAKGKIRYENKTPPGYSDFQKEGVYHYKGLDLQRKYGDLILWFQIIKEAKVRKIKYLIFVSDDEKEDWWWIQANNTLGPRPELVDEMFEEAGVNTFYMYNSSRFLEYAKKFLGVEVKEESINQVGEIQKIPALGEFIQIWIEIEKFLRKIWYSRFPNEHIKLPLQVVHYLYDQNWISRDEQNIFQVLRRYRNKVVHSEEATTFEELKTQILVLKGFLAKLKKIDIEISNIQTEKRLEEKL